MRNFSESFNVLISMRSNQVILTATSTLQACAQAAGGVDKATLQAEAVPATDANLDDLMAQLKALG